MHFVRGVEYAIRLTQCLPTNPLQSIDGTLAGLCSATALQVHCEAPRKERASTGPTCSLESYQERVFQQTPPKLMRMKVQIIDARYIDMGKLLRLLKKKFGEDNFEVESENIHTNARNQEQGEWLRLTAPRILTDVSTPGIFIFQPCPSDILIGLYVYRRKRKRFSGQFNVRTAGHTIQGDT
ncbi:uncharacterized protein KY384_006375 [Bacidia gigantensis]|uniref:uncharacterized protein n=1 Tax=Bacidia gigantensis TaxID=2732470 RepID=UPI001D04BC17|nr:uncharacterized protein KY384_006375 [Bacidia gigantensis]KAG8528688.1 hypothetical protein KY384_006375 [Bacidia gigantensis]